MQESNEIMEEKLSENEIIAIRREKLQELRKMGKAFPNEFHREDYANALLTKYSENSTEALEAKAIHVSVAGRIVLRRLMGKASFCHIQDMSGRIQLYVRQEDISAEIYQEFKKWDIGDIVGAEGVLFKTKTGELSVKVKKIELLTKSLRPLPDKFHGLTDVEMRYRQRYVDLIANESTRKVFTTRSRILSATRKFLSDRGYLEVETPMLHPIAGGAAARPFITHHNTLNRDLFLRIAPELYLKRLVVGGFERVFEVNRNFRNEGISTQHNPEFTMLEFYCAYAQYQDLMNLTEEFMREVAQEVLGTTNVVYQGHTHDLSKPFHRMTVKESILQFNAKITAAELENVETAKKIAESLEIPVQPQWGLGKIWMEIFGKTVEPRISSPTFITAFPTEVSPLARKNDKDPFVTDRFELYLGGFELANGFSELNDPEDQAERFMQQMKEKASGDLEAMNYDEDYITALEYGMPPTAGEGIGIDRLVMFFTDSASIRDVIIFPHMRSKEME